MGGTCIFGHGIQICVLQSCYKRLFCICRYARLLSGKDQLSNCIFAFATLVNLAICPLAFARLADLAIVYACAKLVFSMPRYPGWLPECYFYFGWKCFYLGGSTSTQSRSSTWGASRVGEVTAENFREIFYCSHGN